MKIGKIIKSAVMWLVLGLGLSIVQPVRGQTNSYPQSLFQYAIFYNGLLEFSDCASLTITGPVQCNSNIDIGTPSGSTLTFDGLVSASETITNPPNLGISQNSWTGTTIYNGKPSPGYITGAPALNMPLGSLSNSAAVYQSIINLPNTSDSPTNPISLQRYYYKADLVILVTNITTSITGTNTTNVVTSVTLKNSMFDPAPLTVCYTNYAASAYTNAAIYNALYQMNTNWASWFGSTNSLTNWHTSWLTTNASFYDARQGQTNHVTQIDVGKFGTWIATNTNCLAKWNPGTPFNGIIYVADMRSTNGMYMDCVRLTNGQVIPTVGASNVLVGSSYTTTQRYAIPGLTVGTINPLYIAGLYNCPSNANLGSSNTIGTAPCSVVCDALTLLSPSWIDGNSWAEATSSTLPTASSDTVNTAIIAGNVPSTGTGSTQYSGGVHNLARLLESWTGDTLTLNTSLVNLYPSAQATRQFQQPSAYYNAPTRQFYYDQNFNYTSLLPPGTPLINEFTATVTFSNLYQVFNGSPLSPTVVTTPAGLPVTITYNGSTIVPVNPGTYFVTATINSSTYIGVATNTFVIALGQPVGVTVSLGNLSQTYDGAAESVSVATTPTGVGINVTYNGSSVLPVNAGTYTVIATPSSSEYAGGATNTLIINPASATISLNNLLQGYSGSAESVSITTVPPGVAVNVTYNGSANATPVDPGSYTVVATINNPNYQATPVTNTLVITSPGAATVSVSNLSQVYSGAPESVSVTTVPPGLGVNVTYNGITNLPVNAGSYSVIATINDTNYQATPVSNTLIINQASASISLGSLLQVSDGAGESVSATTVPPGLSVNVTYNGLTNLPVNAGSYAVVATIINPNYLATPATNTLVIVSPGSATISMSNLSQVYSGAPESVSVTTAPPGLSVNVTYNGVTNLPINAGSYTVIATLNDTNFQGTPVTNTLVISQIQVTVSISMSNLSQIYNGLARTVAVTTIPAGIPVTVTYNGVTNAPIGAGSYTVIASNPNYLGVAVTNTLVIAQGTAFVGMYGLSQTYDGTAKSVGDETVPRALNTVFTYNGLTNAPTNAGSYLTIATIVDPNYAGGETNTMVINPAAAALSLSNLTQTYDGTAKSVLATTVPSNLLVNITYNGSTNAPTNSGSYVVVGTILDPNYQGGATNTLVISQATALATLNNLSQTYDGTPKSAGITTVPSGLNVVFTYNGGLNAPTNAGSYLVAGTIADPNYQGGGTNTLVISQAAATLTFSNLLQAYDGTAKNVLAITTPSNLLVNVTYNGSTNAPTNIGSYFIAGAIIDPNYQGSATNTLVINQGVATVALSNLSQAYDGTAKSVLFTTYPPGLGVTATYNGSTNAPVGLGSYTVIAAINDPNYQGATTNTLIIGQGVALATLNNLSQVYDGAPKSAGMTTVPSGLSAVFTYNGGPNAPTNAGSYLVIGTIIDPNYQGGDTNTLVISRAAATLTFSNLAQTYDGTAKSVLATTVPSNLLVNLTYDGSTNAPTNAGSYFVSGAISDPNYQGIMTNTLVISQAPATIGLSNLSQTYDGTAKSVLFMTCPRGLAVNIAYNGSTNAPINVGTYSVVATIVDSNYQGVVTNTLAINQASALVSLNNLLQTYTGSPESVGVTTVPSGLNVAITYNGSPAAPTNAGSYLVTGTVVDPNYQGGDVETMIISQATAPLTFSNLTQTFDGTGKSVCPVTVPTNLLVSVTYDGLTNGPTNAGSYFVAGAISDPNYQGSATNTLVINQAVAGITFSNLLQVFSGAAESVSVTTIPSGLMVNVTYNGSTNAPTNTGSYMVVATVNDTNYQGSATNTLVIVPPATTPIMLSGSTILADGTFQLSFTNTPGGSFSVLGSADPTAPAADWTLLGNAIEVSPGQFQFIDLEATNQSLQFYMITSP